MSTSQEGRDHGPYYFIPFGRYEGSRPAEYPANEVLIGREKPRAELLKHLFSAGRRGAYLITGHRGSGKTSFVQHCLNEYRDDVYQRYLQRNVGRAFFWDRLGQGGLVAVLALTGLLLSQLLAHLVAHPHPGLVAVPLIVFLAVVLGYPWMAAFRLLRVALEIKLPTQRPRLRTLGNLLGRPKPNFVFPLLMTLGVLVSTAVPHLFTPQLALAHAVFVLSVTIALTEMVSTWPPQSQCDSASADAGFEVPADDPTLCLDSLLEVSTLRWAAPWLTLILALASLPALLAFVDAAACTAWSYLLVLVSLLLLSACSAARAWRQGAFSSDATASRDGTTGSARSFTARSWLLALAACVLAWLAQPVFDAQQSPFSFLRWWFALLAFVPPLAAHAAPSPSPRRFNPRPRLLLLAKSYVFLLLGTTLLYPLLTLTLHALRCTFQPAAGLPAAASRFQLFHSATSDLGWLALVVTLVLLLDGAEYDWIIRPLSKMREDFSLHRLRHQPPGERSMTGLSRLRNDYRRIFRETFFYRMYSAWLPVLVVPVNLGFDLLDQRLVVEAMLAGLRDAYQRTFLRWTGVFTAVRRGIVLLVLVLASIAFGDLLFAATTPRQGRSLDDRTFCRDYVDPGFLARADGAPRTGPWLACRLGGETALQSLYWTPLTDPPSQPAAGNAPSGPEAANLLYHLLALHPDPERDNALDLPLYSLLTLLLLGFTYVQVTRRWGLPPYRQIDVRMGEVLDGLSRTLREESRPRSAPFSAWLGVLTGRDTVHLKEGGPFDPRTVELSFLDILRDMQDPRVQIPFVANQRISPPIPEVIFVFDELDKVGVGTPIGDTSGPEDRPNEPLDQERKRTGALHRLFGDLKNTISSGEARFIFIGGRNLHDEWLADQTARRPLLTHIFDLEQYIPSLLTDADLPSAFRPQAIEAFLRRQKFRADRAYVRSRLKRLRPWLSLWVEDLEPLAFVQIPYRGTPAVTAGAKDGGATEQTYLGAPPWPHLTAYDSVTGKPAEPADEFLREMHEFLAYRSKGNVKRLRELLEGFMDPTDSRPPPESPTDEGDRKRLQAALDCDHILAFGQRDRFRIQLVSDLYRHLASILDTRISMRDDKMPQAVLYLADFLLKFHRRAFAWSNVERVDELVHIHRAPDLRLALQGILNAWNDRFLQRIRNGLYDFRCTSELARELEYVSRTSEEELAALNFTLDESQLLKAVYRSRLEVLGPEAGVDFVGGLAELHKFDEEYELARSYLRTAIQALDQRFQREMKEMLDNPVRDSFDARTSGLHALRMRLTWGISRIRLSLQVGMTYERARNFEYALIEYREARTLANGLIASLTGWLDEAANTRGQARQGLDVELFEARFLTGDEPERTEFLGTLKHLHVVFQPLFAEAWVSEKLMSGVDTATGLLETELWGLRQILPFVNARSFDDELGGAAGRPPTGGPVNVRHSTFALVMAELYNKAGDLLFFKGRQLVSKKLAETWAGVDRTSAERHGAEGYLLRALDHYCVSLHDLRRFVVCRRHGSARRYGLPSTTGKVPWSPIEKEGWTDFMRRVAAGSLADIADAFLARFSYTALLYDLKRRPDWDGEPRSQGDLEAMRGALKDACDLIVEWFETPSETLHPGWGGDWSHHAAALVSWIGPEACRLADWFGTPAGRCTGESRPGELLCQDANNPDPERLVSSMMLSMASAWLLERSGYHEAAGQRYLRVSTTVAELLWWRLAFHAVIPVVSQTSTTWQYALDHDILSPEAKTAALGFFDELFCVAVLALEEAEDAFLHARRYPRAWSELGSEIGIRIPAEALTAACSLALAAAHSSAQEPASRGDKFHGAWDRLRAMVERWSDSAPGPEGDADFFRQALSNCIRVRRYPMLNRLNGLKVLLDEAIHRTAEDEEIRRLLRRLVVGNEEYDSRLHFTPMQLGTSLALVWLLRRDGLSGPAASEEICRRAQDLLRTSQQMYTLQKGYYDSISNLYYLYDDFNDRCIHFNHALQMAGTELVTFLLRNLEEESAPSALRGRSAPRRTDDQKHRSENDHRRQHRASGELLCGQSPAEE